MPRLLLSARDAPPFSASRRVEEPGSLKVSVEVEDERVIGRRTRLRMRREKLGMRMKMLILGLNLHFFQAALLEGRAKSKLHRRVVF